MPALLQRILVQERELFDSEAWVFNSHSLNIFANIWRHHLMLRGVCDMHGMQSVSSLCGRRTQEELCDSRVMVLVSEPPAVTNEDFLSTLVPG